MSVFEAATTVVAAGVTGILQWRLVFIHPLSIGIGHCTPAVNQVFELKIKAGAHLLVVLDTDPDSANRRRICVSAPDAVSAQIPCDAAVRAPHTCRHGTTCWPCLTANVSPHFGALGSFCRSLFGFHQQQWHHNMHARSQIRFHLHIYYV